MRIVGSLAVVLAATIVTSPVLAEDRGPITRHALWKIDGGRSPVYLLGSIHILRRQNYPLERPIEDAFEEARVVAFEIDLDEARAAIARTESREEHERPRGTLRSQVSPKTYEAVVCYLEDAGMPGTLLDDVSPPLAASALVQLELKRLGFDPEWGVDAYYYRRARKYGKTVVPLESVPEQLDTLADLSDRASDELIGATLEDVAALRTMLRDLIRAWKGGEVDRLAMLVNGAFYDKPHVYGPMLADRNTRWVPKIEQLLAGEEPAIVIVGTGHLVGETSLVAMLQAKGYVVTQQ